MSNSLKTVAILVALLLATLAGRALVAETADDAEPRPGYMIVIGTGVDSPRMGPYAAATVPLLLEFGGELLFISEEHGAEILEGGPFESSIRVFRFPSLQHARDFYYSEAYQREAIPLREGLGQLNVIVSDAFVPDPRWLQAGD